MASNDYEPFNTRSGPSGWEKPERSPISPGLKKTIEFFKDPEAVKASATRTFKTYEDVQRLVVKMREGSKEARRELIEAHVALAFKSARDYEDDEALSDALCALVEEVDAFRVSGRHPAALPAYLKVALRNAAAKHQRDTSNMPERPGGGRITRHCSLNDAKKFLRSGREVPEYKDQALVDLMDEILALCETEEEQEMVYWRSQSLTYAEVATRIGSNYAHVQRSLERLQHRLAVRERFTR